MSRKEARKKSGQLLAAHILWYIVCLRLDYDFYLLAILKFEVKRIRLYNYALY